MSKRIQLRRGTTAETNTFTGAVGEVTVDTDKKTVVVHDGTTVGGTPLARVSEIPSLVPQATETIAGKAKIATTAIAQAGTNDTDIITAKKLRNALNASGSAPAFAVRAWLNFNGTGTVAVRGGGNIASVIDDGVGTYTIDFITPMPSDNYAIAQMGSVYLGGGNSSGMYLTERTTSATSVSRTVNSFQVQTINANNSSSDVLSGSLLVVC